MLELLRRALRPQPVGHREHLIDCMIKSAKRFGATSPREAAEIASGHAYTEAEWARKAELWNRLWY